MTTPLPAEALRQSYLAVLVHLDRSAGARDHFQSIIDSHDALQAEVERLRGNLHDAADDYHAMRHRAEKAEAENARLRSLLAQATEGLRAIKDQACICDMDYGSACECHAGSIALDTLAALQAELGVEA